MENEYSIEVRRFREVREDYRYTQRKFAELLNIKNSTADIERGKTKLSGKTVMLLMEKFKINPSWIFGESNQKYVDGSNKPIETLPKMIAVDTEGNENVLLVNQKAAAGYPQNIGDAEWHRQLPAFDIPLPEFRNASYRGFQVEGDSMLPVFYPDDWVLAKAVSNLNEINDNKIYVVVTTDSVLVKKLKKLPGKRKIRLISINEEYEPFELEVEEIRELWRVNSRLTFNLDAIHESNILKQLQDSMEELKTQIHDFSQQKKPLDE